MFEKVLLIIYVLAIFVITVNMTEHYSYQKGYITAQIEASKELPSYMYSEEFAEWLWSGQTLEKE